MPLIRCTQCGAINDTGAADYPFCVGCQDNLAKCGTCQWFDSQLIACTDPGVAGVFDVSAQATPPCGHYSPRSEVLVRRKTLWAAVGLGLAAAVLLLVWALFQIREPRPPRPAPRPELVLTVTAGMTARVGHSYAIACEVYNKSRVPAREVRVVFDKDFLARFGVAGEWAGAKHWEEGERWMSLRLPDLGPGEAAVVNLEVIPREVGRFQTRVRLESSGNQFYGHVPLLVRVEPEPEGRRDSDTGGRKVIP